MATERSRQLLLAGLVVVLLVVVIRLVTPATPAPETSSAPATASNSQGASATPQGRRTPATAATPGAPDVHLDELNAERAKPEPAERNLFRFKPKAPPPPPPAPPPVVQPPAPVVPTGPPPPPPLPPITLKFIGIVESPSQGEKIAILSDGRNAPFYGKEGAIIEGRYRIVKIGVESVELAYADGRGRQTIRLTGS
jgi:hypothetical protein